MMAEFVKIDFERIGKKSAIVSNLLSTFEEQIEDSFMVDNTITTTLDHIKKEAMSRSEATIGKNSENFNLSIQNFVKNYARLSKNPKAVDNLLKQFGKKFTEFHSMGKTAVKNTESILFEATNKKFKISKDEFEEELDGLIDDYQNINMVEEEQIPAAERVVHEFKSDDSSIKTTPEKKFLGKRTPKDMIPKMLEELKNDSDHLMMSSPIREEGYQSPTIKTIKKGNPSNPNLKRKKLTHQLVPIDVDMSDDVEDSLNEKMDEEENAIKDFKPLYNHLGGEDNYQNNVSKINLERLQNSKKKPKKKHSFL